MTKIKRSQQGVITCVVSDRAKVIKGLPDVVAIMEGKVEHYITDTTGLLSCTFITIILLSFCLNRFLHLMRKAGVQES